MSENTGSAQGQVTEYTHAAVHGAVADAQRQGWQVEASGHGWARLGKFQPVNHVGLFLLSIFTAGIGLIFWMIAASQGPQWTRMIISADAYGQVTVTHLDKKGQPRRG